MRGSFAFHCSSPDDEMLTILQKQGLAKKEAKSNDMVDRPKATEQNEHDDRETDLDMEVQQKKAKPLGFLYLPAETRNKIYRLALVTTPNDCGDETLIFNLAPPALTLVNKQILAEALPIYYAENNFYLLLWARNKIVRDQDPALFHRFTRMMQYFGRQTTSPTDQSPMRHIKNIVVQINTCSQEVESLFWSNVHTSISPDSDQWAYFTARYSSLCIRGEQQKMTFTSDPATEEGPFDPTKYRWIVKHGFYEDINTYGSIQEAHDLVRMSFTGRTQPIEKAVLVEHEEKQMDALYLARSFLFD